jgi:hypothetical protein
MAYLYAHKLNAHHMENLTRRLAHHDPLCLDTIYTKLWYSSYLLRRLRLLVDLDRSIV